MRTVVVIFALSWIAFWTYWIIAASFSKKGSVSWSRHLRIRAVLLVVIIVLLRLGAFRNAGVHSNTWRAGVGLALYASGLALAIWARVHIGRNWGTPMTRKEKPELVTSGPYRYIRHPIYSGILLAGVGSVVGLSWRWLVPLLLVAVYFFYSASVEERYMQEQFPDAYPTYRATTRMFVPFIF